MSLSTEHNALVRNRCPIYMCWQISEQIVNIFVLPYVWIFLTYVIVA